MKSKLAPIYAIETVSSFAGSLLAIFVEVYLLTIGLSVRNVMEFLLIQTVAGFVAIVATSWASRHVPLKVIMLMRIPVLIVFLGLLVAAKSHAIPFAVLATLQGFQFVLYYLPLHVFFTFGSSEESVGRQLGLLGAIPKFVCIGAPVLGGFIAARWGFNIVFVATAILYALSALPMLRLPAYKTSFSLSITDFRNLFAKYRTYFWLEVVENIQEELDLVIWPLVVFLTVKSTIQTGAASSLIAAGSAFFTFVIGRRTDRSDKFQLLHLGGLLMLGLWLWRLWPLSPESIFIISTLVGFAGVLISIPFGAIIYNLARVNHPRKFVIFREVPILVARTFVYGVAVLVASDIKQLFWLAIAAYAIFAVMPRFNIAGPSADMNLDAAEVFDEAG